MDTFNTETPAQHTDQPVQGSSHTNRVLLKSCKSRALLLKYSGYSRDRKCIQNPKNLTASELQVLLKKRASTLAQAIRHPSSETHHRQAPQPYREWAFTEHPSLWFATSGRKWGGNPGYQVNCIWSWCSSRRILAWTETASGHSSTSSLLHSQVTLQWRNPSRYMQSYQSAMRPCCSISREKIAILFPSTTRQ